MTQRWHAKKNSRAGKKFVKVYKNICKFINIAVAEEDLGREKAFTDSSLGTVLGIFFDTTTGKWSLPEWRYITCTSLIRILAASPTIHLQQVQQLMGNLEAVCQLAPFAKGFKWNILQLLRSFGGNQEQTLPVPDQVKEDLHIWLRILATSCQGLPLIGRPKQPPIGCLQFETDAMGRGPSGTAGRPAAASLGIFNHRIWHKAVVEWPL